MCDCQCRESTPRRRTGILGTLVQIVLVYGLLVFGGGTLIHTGHPVAMEVGRLLHTVTLVEPGIYWAESGGHDALAGGLRHMAYGINFWS